MSEHELDIAFLVRRQSEAGRCTLSGDRWTGMSSNALVCLAYGGEQGAMPSDRSDYASCVRTVRMLPRHRRTAAVMGALWKAKEAYLTRYPTHRSAMNRRAERQAWEREQEQKAKRRDRRRRAA